VPEEAEAKMHEGPRRCRPGAFCGSWDQLSGSAYPTPPPKGGAHV